MRRGCWLVLVVVAACGDGTTPAEDAAVTPTPSAIHAPTSITIVEGETTTFSVTLSDPPSGGVMVNVSSMDPNAATVAPSTIMFSPDRVTADVTVTAGEDNDDVINEMTDIVLSIEAGDSQRVATRVMDNDVQQIVADATNVTVNESATTMFSVRLARQPSAPVTLSVWSDAPLIASVNPATVTFDPTSYNVAQTVSVTGVVDANTMNGAAHVFVGQLPSVTDVTVDVAVTDDDVQALVLGATNLPLTEGANATFTVSLAFDPVVPTSVQLQSSDPSAAAPSTSTLQFTSSNYNVPQTVTILGTEDDDQLNESVTLAVSGPATGSVTVPVLDNDLIKVLTQVNVPEAGTVPYYIALADHPGSAGLTISVEVVSGDVTVSPSSQFFADSSFSIAREFLVTAIGDHINVTRMATLRFSAPGQAPRDVTFTIDDRIPGSMNHVMVGGSPIGAGGARYLDVTMGLRNLWPADGRAVISLPPGYDASAATFVSSSVSGSYAITATTSNITVTRSNGAPVTGDVTLRFGNVVNPPVSGTYQVGAATQATAGEPIDSGSGIDVIGSGPLSNVSMTLGDLAPGATTTATLTFTGRNPWPADGKLVISVSFPSLFDLSNVVVTSQSGVDGTFTAVGSGSQVTLTRGGGTTTPGNTPISITLANVGNPTTAQAVNSVELVTQSATSARIDQGFTGGFVIGCPATMTKAPRRGSNVAFGGDAWLYPEGITEPYSGEANIYMLDESDYLIADVFEFTVPTGATVTGIQFNVEHDTLGWNAVDSSVRVVKSTIGQVDHASSAFWTDQPVSYGGATDLWGETWTAADIESDSFGIAVAAKAAVPGMPPNYVRINYITATVHLSCP